MKKLVLLFLVIPFLWSCQNESDAQGDYWVDIATVSNPGGAKTFYFTLDDSTRLWASSSDLVNYTPKDGQRIVAYYTVLGNKPAGASYDHEVRLNDAYEVLTKNIFNITAQTQDSIGNDYIYIDNIWIGSDYLNVEFVYAGYNKTHYINLVSDASKTYNDGKIHLEFRHNSNGDIPSVNQWGLASFNLKKLRNGSTAAGSVDLVIHTREYGQDDKTYNLTYKYGAGASSVVPQNINVRANKAILR